MDPSTHADRERRILSLWEQAVGRSRWSREDVLLGNVAPLALGERNRALLVIRNALFSPSLQLRSDCPACGTECEFAIDSVALAEALEEEQPPADDGASFDWHGRPLAVRAPTADDLRGIADHDDVPGAARALLARCLPADIALSQLSEEDFVALESWIEGLDPGAALAFAMACPDCGHQWPAPFDVADVLWAELQRAAELSLTDVDALARIYGWTEEQVVSLSPVRRAAYLQLAAAR